MESERALAPTLQIHHRPTKRARTQACSPDDTCTYNAVPVKETPPQAEDSDNVSMNSTGTECGIFDLDLDLDSDYCLAEDDTDELKVLTVLDAPMKWEAQSPRSAPISNMDIDL